MPPFVRYILLTSAALGISIYCFHGFLAIFLFTIQPSFSIPFLVNGRPLTAWENLITIGSLLGLLSSFFIGPLMAYFERNTVRAISEGPATRLALYTTTALSHFLYVLAAAAYYIISIEKMSFRF